MDNLPELRDIHIPDGVSAFPPAYGWWIVLLIILLFPLIIRLFKTARQKSRKFYALSIVNKINGENAVIGAVKISELLKRICLYKYPEAVNMFGKEWIEFLKSHTKQHISEKAAELLSNAPYIAKDSAKYDKGNLNELKEYTKKWIGENL